MIKTMKISILVISAMLMIAGFAFATATPEEAEQLGKNLTMIGAEAAGNKDGTIPAYTGGLGFQAPAGHVKNSGRLQDPFISEKPLYAIDAKNMAQYTDKLTEGTKALMQKFPSFRVDVYKTHRSITIPDFIQKNTKRLATTNATADNGESVKVTRACTPFPIPKTGNEVMWNHNLRYQGVGRVQTQTTDLVDANGTLYEVSQMIFWEHWPYYDEKVSAYTANNYFRDRWIFTLPARKAGEGGLAYDPFNIGSEPRKAWLYLPGQRRVKLAPQVAYDTPSSDGNGNFTYDETWQFNCAMDRYNMKLLGKREMYVPYNAYRVAYPVSKESIYGQRHIKPEAMRWELHRVWVVEATLKPGARHIYKTRRFYIDEDSWTCIAQDIYDAANKLFKADFTAFCYDYDIGASVASCFLVYNFNNGCYVLAYTVQPHQWRKADTEAHSENWWAPDNLMSTNIR